MKKAHPFMTGAMYPARKRRTRSLRLRKRKGTALSGQAGGPEFPEGFFELRVLDAGQDHVPFEMPSARGHTNRFRSF